MTVTTSYPGVYIEELASSAMSVSNSATAVPAFAIADNDTVFTEPVTRISSWLDYMGKVGNTFDSTSVRDISLRTYFENGGGYCYLIPTQHLPSEMPKLVDVTLLVAAGQDINSDITQLCGDGSTIFAILDGPVDDITQSNEDETATYNTIANSAIYYPWLNASWADIAIPPSAAVAGAYCLNDRTRGVWKAPANMVLQGGVTPAFKVTDDLQGRYTQDKAFNMIRQFNNSNTVIWGARTCKDNDAWRYVPVRRLFNTVERDIKSAMQVAMFEPNSQPTWESVRSAITNYLYGLWQQGGLTGSNAEEAFFVQVGKNVTMTEDDIKQGKMIIKVGMAAVRPAEFIILQFSQDVAK